MSFGDLEKGVLRTGLNREWEAAASTSSSVSDSNQDTTTTSRISHTIFTISNNIATLQKLLSLFGTQKDTPEMRSRLHQTTEQTRDLIRQTTTDMKSLLSQPNTDKRRKLAHQKLQKDFENVLKRFQSVSKLAAEKSREYVALARAAHNESDHEDEPESAPLLQSSQSQLIHLNNEIEYNESLIHERESDLQQIEQSIAEVNEIFRDLGTMVHEQQYMLDNIESNVQSVEINMEGATGELRTAERYQRGYRRRLCCIMVVVAIVVLVLVLVIVA